jgi:DNA-directed RNA polymerase subunit RPC12/RpoP
MIILTKADSVDDEDYDHVKCPQCNWKLCSKQIGVKAYAMKIDGKSDELLRHLLFQCYRCKSKWTARISLVFDL